MNYKFCLYVSCVIGGSIFGMQENSNVVVKKWPTHIADRAQERVNFILASQTPKEGSNAFIPLYQAVREVVNSKEKNIAPVQTAWESLAKYEDAIPVGNHFFTRKDILTAAFCLCTQSKGVIIANFLASQKPGIYPHVRFGKQIGILHSAANGNGIFGSTNADDEWLNSHWEDDQYVKLLDVCAAQGIYPNYTNPSKQLPLHFAAAYRSLDVVKKLCLSKDWLTLKDIDGHTPLDFAESNSNFPVVEYLQNGHCVLKPVD